MGDAADYAGFAEVAEGLSALGPEMAIVGGVLSLCADLFGGPS